MHGRHNASSWCPLVIVALLFFAHAHAADQVVIDQWFVGTLNNQPSLQAHALVTRHADGSSTDAMDTVVVIARTLGGQSIRFEARESQTFDVDPRGRIRSFRFDHVESDAPTVATGRIDGTTVRGAVVRLGRRSEITIPIPEGQELLGQQAGQEWLVKRPWKTGDQARFTQLALLGNQLQLVQTTATFTNRDQQDQLGFDVVMDAMPIPMGIRLKANGDLAGMTMNLGFFNISVTPSNGPVTLDGAALDVVNLVTAAGPAPRQGDGNRFRLPTGVTIPNDQFQRQDGAVVTTSSTAAVEPVDVPDAYFPPFLRAEPQLELDDPDLRAWVEAAAADAASPMDKAEQLRQAVRTHIAGKDLSQGDASALEAFRSRRGDCTEHANLLCAALRIAGIPARVDVGLVYSSIHGGWVGHAWNSAYLRDPLMPTSGRWVHLDSAFPGVPRSCYLKLGSTSGGTWKATGAALMGTLGGIMGKTIETVP